MQSVVSIPGIPVYVCDPVRGMVLYMVPIGTPFMEVATWVPMQAPVVVEQQQAPAQAVVEQPVPAEEEGLTDEEREALDAALAQETEAELDEAVLEWEAEDDAQEEEQQAHVAQLLEEDEDEQERGAELSEEEEAVEAKKEELHRLFRELYKLSEIQKPLYKAVKAMEAERDPKKRAENKAKYWETWNRMVDAQKKWLKTLEALRALDTELACLDRGYNFNTLANKTWYPDEPERDYWTLYAKIELSFKGNISRDEERRERGQRPAADKPALETLQLSLADLIAAHVGGHGRA
jgi:hypothetical protein